MIKTVQIKGANASGKTTIMKQLIEQSSNILLLDWGNKVMFTVLRDIKFVLIGDYPTDSKMGGMDLIDTAATVRKAMTQAVEMFPNYRAVIVEGMLLVNTKRTYYDFQLHLYKRYGCLPYVVLLKTTLESCMKRLEGRGTMRAGGVNINNIADKLSKLYGYADYYGDRARWIDVDKTRREDMLSKFLTCINEKL